MVWIAAAGVGVTILVVRALAHTLSLRCIEALAAGEPGAWVAMVAPAQSPRTRGARRFAGGAALQAGKDDVAPSSRAAATRPQAAQQRRARFSLLPTERLVGIVCFFFLSLHCMSRGVVRDVGRLEAG